METSRNSCYKKSIICIGVRCALFCYLALFLHCKAISQEFNPMTDAKGYMLHFFHIADTISISDSLAGYIGDTLSISWHQPKSDDSTGQPKPQFYNHDDTIRVWIPNDSTLYKYWWTGNDSSCWISKELELYGGSWELSVTCFDHADNISQYADPFQFKIHSIPGQPYEVNIIIKRKKK